MRTITFDQPASNWNEALPIGNGKLGAMIFSQCGQERIQLNADSIWYGGPQERCNKDALGALPRVRELILQEENIEEAQNLLQKAFSGTPQSQRPYQTAGDLMLSWKQEERTQKNYKRGLNLTEGSVISEFDTESGKVRKEYLASYPDQVMAFHFEAEKEETLTFLAMLIRGRFYDGTAAMGEDGICLWGNEGKDGVEFVIGLRAVQHGGKIEITGEQLEVKNAREVTLYLAIETSFYEKGDLRRAVEERLENAVQKGYESLRSDHVRDYQELFDRVELELSTGTDGADPAAADSTDGADPAAADSTDGADPAVADSVDPAEQERLAYAEDYFQFGRYLCIASSRPGSLPANLQGIWNESMTPPWDSKYTININLEMNYWPVQSCNLSECERPLFDHLKRMCIRGQEVAKKMYGCRGFVAHHNTDIWADCAPQDIYIPATYWVMGGAWLCTHVWRYYRYTQDKAFLAEMYPVLKEAVLFFEDYLVEHEGKLLTCPTVSPENTYILPSGHMGQICAGAAMDNEILRDLLSLYQKAAAELGIEEELVQKAAEMADRIPKIQIGSHGQIMEWREDYEEAEPGHRHISQLYALYPSDQISEETADGTAGCELRKAARTTLERRLKYGGGHTGWSCAWIIGLYARLGDGEKAWEYLNKMFDQSTFPNRFCNHPMGPGHVFQIDGNFGSTAAMAEMLVCSNEKQTTLLPALPKAWANGHVRGLVIQGGAQVEMTWRDHELTYCKITARKRTDLLVGWKKEKMELHLEAEESREIFGQVNFVNKF